MAVQFGYKFPAIRGVQAGREYYASMCPLRLLPKIFLFDEEELIPELRAQRSLNKGRLPEMARYVVENPSGYVFSAITASIDGKVRFEPLGSDDGSDLGVLHVDMSAKFVINDGQHRRAAIELALRERPELGDESISVVFFMDLGLERSQQMFADLNRYAVRPSRSIGVLYDHRDHRARITRRIVDKVPLLKECVERERSSLSPRSRCLFTLSALYTANRCLLANLEVDEEEQVELAAAFWTECAQHLPEWELVRRREISAAEVRRDLIHSHGVVLQALGHVGNYLLRRRKGTWRRVLTGLKKIDWARGNAELWEGRALVGGRVSKASTNVILTTNAIKKSLGLPLSANEQRLENSYERGLRGEEEALEASLRV